MTAKLQKKIGKIMKDEEYFKCVEDLLCSDPVKLMDEYVQHGSTTTLEHCINVSYQLYKISKKLKLDYKSSARAGLLHDMFLYDWHSEPKADSFFNQHGFTHAKTALDNACKYFELNDKEKDIIEKHMWPLTLTKLPKYKESFLITVVDKYTTSCEAIVPLAKKTANYALLVASMFYGIIH